MNVHQAWRRAAFVPFVLFIGSVCLGCDFPDSAQDSAGDMLDSSTSDGEGGASNMELLCYDGEDGDADGLVDCQDPDCTGQRCELGSGATCDASGVCVGDGQAPSCADGLSCEEVCGNGEDDDGDGVSDEECPCAYTGSALGVCADSVVTLSGICRAPIRYQSPELSCDGLDNDCDGIVDEGCPCDYLERPSGVCPLAFSDARGACAVPGTHEGEERRCDAWDNDCGVDTDEGCSVCTYLEIEQGVCLFGRPGATSDSCSAPAAFEPEEVLCDGVDNDCDGVTDEGCPCDFQNLAQGVCRRGLRAADAANTCLEPAGFEADESSCDGLDNDCDGEVDEGCDTCPFGNAIGVCASGRTAGAGCEAPARLEEVEFSCDGLDNDCDGTTDEGCPCTFANSIFGVCRLGRIDEASATCARPVGYLPDERVVCDGLDNDCDGFVDEGCPCVLELGNEGVCARAVRDIVSGVCEPPAVFESEETTCDGYDNDCDGTTDEGCGVPCAPAAIGVCAESVADAQLICREPSSFVATESVGSCDGVDNDCDGVVDEGCLCDFQGRARGVCARSGEVDDAGVCPSPVGYSVAERCDDAVDNDCNGLINDGCACRPPNTPAASQASMCPGGVLGQVTEVGTCVPAPGIELPEETSCDGADNDCDGVVDEGCVLPAIERCDNGLDDDGDGAIDCDDPDCPKAFGCDHVVFVGERMSLFGLESASIEALDDKCTAEARGASVQGSFKAVLAQAGAAAFERVDLHGDVRAIDGSLVGTRARWMGRDAFQMSPITTLAGGLPGEVLRGGSVLAGAFWGLRAGGAIQGSPVGDCEGYTRTGPSAGSVLSIDLTRVGVPGMLAAPDAYNLMSCDAAFRLLCISGQ